MPLTTPSPHRVFSPQRLTDAARHEMHRRGLTIADVAYCFRHGQRIHSGCCQFIFLRNKDIPSSDRSLSDARRRNGIVLRLDRRGRITRVLWNRRAGRWFRRPKYTVCPLHGSGRWHLHHARAR